MNYDNSKWVLLLQILLYGELCTYSVYITHAMIVYDAVHVSLLSIENNKIKENHISSFFDLTVIFGVIGITCRINSF